MSGRAYRKSIFLMTMLFIVIGSCLFLPQHVYRKHFSGEIVEPEFVLCYGEVNSEEHIMSVTAQYFANKVKELSNGKIVVQVYSSGQLGDDAKCYQALSMGALDLYRGNSASLSGEKQPLITSMALPYVFRNREHFWKVCRSDLGDAILNDINISCPGIIGLAYLDEGARGFFTVNKPIQSLKDMEGLELRVQMSDMMEDTVRYLGADAVQTEYVELYYMLETGIVDGAENPIISYYYNQFYQVAPNYVTDSHTYAPSVLLISELTWNNLGEEYQQVIMEAAKLTESYNQYEIAKEEERVYCELKKRGVNFTSLSDYEDWKKAVEPIYMKRGEEIFSIIDEIREMY